ncbi:Fc.00g054210.m01.CDS01 [Cosmosporella sp. VM-42]
MNNTTSKAERLPVVPGADFDAASSASHHKQPKSQHHHQRHHHRQHQKQAKQQQQQHQQQEKIAQSSSAATDATTANPLPQETPDISSRVVFGPGTIARLPAELARLHLSAPLIVSSPSRVALAKKIQTLIANLDSRILDSAISHVPTHVIDDALSRISGRDCVISVGGGSAVSLARVIGLRKRLPHICIPTTYSGSEITPYVEAKKDGKRATSSRESRIVPTVVIYDEDLTMSLPKRFSAPSGISAMAHNSESRQRPKDDDALWSYIHLPGV